MTGRGPGLPLSGKTVLVPRGKDHAKGFSERIINYGGIPVEVPLIAFKPVAKNEHVQNMINELPLFDWIVFTSNVTVDTFLTFIKGTKPKKMPRIAAIGKKTAAVIKAAGFEVDFIPTEFVAEGFVKDFLPLVKKGMKILIPKGNLARNIIYTALTEIGAIVEEVIVYETYLPDESRKELVDYFSHRSLDILTFTSPSTIDHFMTVIHDHHFYEKLEACIICCIGPITKERIQSYGLQVHCEPKIYTVDHMLESMIDYLTSKKV